jgi:hypothetical protein
MTQATVDFGTNGQAKLHSIFNDDNGVGFGGVAQIVWDTTDANANMLKIELPAGGSVDVPVILAGIGHQGEDLTFFNGVTQPTLGVVDADRDSWLVMDFSADDAARIRSNRDIDLSIIDNSATSMTIKQGSDAYLIIDTADSSESVSIGTGISGMVITLGHAVSEVTVNDNLTVTGYIDLSNAGDIRNVGASGNDWTGTEFSHDGGATFNASNGNYDFRIESVNNGNVFKIDASRDAVGIGMAPGAEAGLTIAAGKTFTTGTNVAATLIANNNALTIDGYTAARAGAVDIYEPNFAFLNSGAVTTAYTLRVRGPGAADGTNVYSLWVDDGSVRLDGSLFVEGTPTEGTSGEQLESAGTGAVPIWAAAGSQAAVKNIHGTLSPDEALDTLLAVDVPHWHYRREREDGTRATTTGDYDTEYVGVLAEDFPEVMHHGGRIFAPVSAFGYTVAAVQKLEARIRELEEVRHGN